MRPLLSIIIPIYNVEKYLERCLNSIATQTFKDFEVILVNDGSTDQSKFICEGFCEKDSRFKLINQINKGAGAARNNGIQNALGDYICFIDSDDWIEADYLEKIIYSRENYDIIFWGYTIDSPSQIEQHQLNELICNDRNKCYNAILDLKKHYEYGFTVTCLLKTEIIKQYNILFPTNIQLHEDIVFINKYCAYINSLRIIDLSSYHYMKYSETSLSRRYIPYDEAKNIAIEVFKSSKHWHNNYSLFNFELKGYINWLVISVINIYNGNNKLLNYKERISHIKMVLSEISKYNFDISYFPIGRKLIFSLKNPYLMDLSYSIIRRLRTLI